MANGDNILATVKTGEVILNQIQQERIGGPAALSAAGVPGFDRGGKVELNEKLRANAFANGGLIPRFTAPMFARPYQSGGVAAVQSAQQLQGAIQIENERLAELIKQAVAEGAALGTQQGVENSDISGQLEREQERKARQNENESL